jgi:hypothetical protein
MPLICFWAYLCAHRGVFLAHIAQKAVEQVFELVVTTATLDQRIKLCYHLIFKLSKNGLFEIFSQELEDS